MDLELRSLVPYRGGWRLQLQTKLRGFAPKVSRGSFSTAKPGFATAEPDLVESPEEVGLRGFAPKVS